jgi:hypothetical protein
MKKSEAMKNNTLKHIHQYTIQHNLTLCGGGEKQNDENLKREENNMRAQILSFITL